MTDFQLVESAPHQARITVIGVGGGGNNTVKHLSSRETEGIQLICANTDIQTLGEENGVLNLPLGQNTSKGLGAGANPEVGRKAALEDQTLIAEAINRTEMLFVTAGMGGGTGTGAAPVIAGLAKEASILTVGVVTLPFNFEGRKRFKVAEAGLTELRENVHSLLVIPNQILLDMLDPSTTVLSAFASVNDVLGAALAGIANVITRPGLINLDFNDVKTVMREEGMAMFGTGIGRGKNRAAESVNMAVECPLLYQNDLHQAKGILVNICSGDELSLGELHEVGETIGDLVQDTATVIVGTSIDPTLKDALTVTLIATGLEDPARKDNSRPLSAGSDSGQPSNTFEVPAILERGKIKPLQKGIDVPAFLRKQAD